MKANLAEGVAVLVEEAVALVHDLTGVVLDAKERVLHTRADVESASTYMVVQGETSIGFKSQTTMRLVQLDEQGGISALGEAAFLIEKRQDAKLALNQIEAL